MKYRLTIEFTAGLLKGIVYSSETSVYRKPGTVTKKALGGGSYKVIDCVRIDPS